MDNYNYPIGSDTPEAPWNQSDPKPEEIEVVVSLTLSKVLKVKVTDYTTDVDEDGNSYNDYSECDIAGAVTEQVDLPGDSTWDIDDFEVILN